MIRAYHFVGTKLRDGSPVPADGEWLQFDGKISICNRGFHASRHVSDACKHAPGSILCLVDLDGEIQEQQDKICASRRRIVARFDAMELLHKDARESASSVLHLWNAPDVVVNFLKTGNKELLLKARIASSATYAAAPASAEYASRAAYAAASATSAATYAYSAYAVAQAAAAAQSAAATYAYSATYAAYAATSAATYSAYFAANRKRLQDAVATKFDEILK